jgi:chromosome segregation ATPase
MIIEDDFNNMKSEKESLESFLELNTSDITTLQEKLEKKRGKYQNCKIERNNFKAALEAKDLIIKDLKLIIDENEKTILELRLTISQLTDQLSACKSNDNLTSKNEELYSKIKILEISNLTFDKEIKNMKEEKDSLIEEFNNTKISLEGIKSANNDLKLLKDKFEREAEDLKKNILEVEKQKSKLKEDLELEKKKLESFTKVSENEIAVKEKKIEDGEIKLNEVKAELKVLQGSYTRLQQV